MQIFIKIIISVVIILTATGIAGRFPSAAGLIGVMPLTGALILIWVYMENKGNPEIMQGFTRGALFGIAPSVLFFLTALLCFKKEFSLPIVLILSFAVWTLAAFVHQWFLK